MIATGRLSAARVTLSPPPLHARQGQVAFAPARFKVAACGRRWGKTRLGAVMCVKTAADGGRAWWVAPTYPVAQVGWRLIRRLAAQVPGATVRQSERLVTFPNGGEIQVRSADNPDSLRGDGLNFVVMDECAFIHEDAWFEALRPALSDRRGRALFISTPKGRNWFWRLWQRCVDEHDREWHGWQLPTADNPFIDAAEIEAARRGMAERTFAQEYLAQFLDDAGGVFRNVATCAVGEVVPPRRGGQYVYGIDWAFSHDYTVVSILDAGARRQVYVDRFNGVDYTLQRERIGALAALYPPTVVVAEENAMGRPNNEALRRAGLPVRDFHTGQGSKAQIIEDLAAALERADLILLRDPVQRGELEAYEGQRTAAGTRYGAPSGIHDDTVMALALAYSAMSTGGAGAFSYAR